MEMKKQDLILNNARKFVGLCPYKGLNENMQEFHAENGTVFLKWSCQDKLMSANIGSNCFSACIVDTKNMKPIYILDGEIDDNQAIQDFFHEVAKWFGYAKVAYCIENTSSTGFVNNNQTIIIGVLHD